MEVGFFWSADLLKKIVREFFFCEFANFANCEVRMKLCNVIGCYEIGINGDFWGDNSNYVFFFCCFFFFSIFCCYNSLHIRYIIFVNRKAIRCQVWTCSKIRQPIR